MKYLPVIPLTAENFRQYGDVIELQDQPSFQINYGMADRHHAQAKVDVRDDKGYPVISLVHSKKYELPQKIKIVERHPLGSQAFIPRDKTAFVVVVAGAGDTVQASQLKAFKTNGEQGINYHTGIWHGLLLTPFDAMSFICVDRDGSGENCEQHHFSEQDQYTLDIKV